MLRCALLAATLVAATAATSASAQTRNFPANALRGELTVTAPPEVQLNGKPARLAPGARIRGADNMLVMSGAVIGQRFLVHYTTDIVGNVHSVWVLTRDEAERKPWPTTAEEAARWSFNPDQQTWSKP